MRSVLVVHIVYSFDTGGLEKGIATLVQNASSSVKHTIICLSKAGDSVRLLPKDTPVIALKKKQGNSLRFIFKLARVLKKLKPDIVHTRNWSGMDGVLAARLANIKTVVHGEHGWDLEDPFGKNSKRVFVRRFFSRWIKEYTCVSVQMKTWLEREIRVPNRVTQIYNGVDTGVYRPDGVEADIRSKYNISNSAPLIGIVARLDPIKDHMTLFHAFSIVKKQIPEAKLLVIGDGPQKKILEEKAGEGVIFLGNCPDVPDIMRSLTVFTLTSLNEGISNTLLEAMATGLPIVATRVGGNTEIIANGVAGSLIDPGNPKQLADALLDYLMNEGKRLQHGRMARKTAGSDYSLQSMVEKYEKVYGRVAIV
ncbi:glycosyltransferase [Desulfospira joergensenii]|uniref:glycosyltransferase n=1 Tax=Desulfospira joergensenii TaxID=53329 RepID=UPI0003B6F505|nr:glycosyltransferase [Desulfospira joergensenii]